MRRVVAILTLCVPGPAVSLLILGHPVWAAGGVLGVAGGYLAVSLLYGAGVTWAWVFLAGIGLSMTINLVMMLATLILPVRTGQPGQAWWGYLVAGFLGYAAVGVMWGAQRVLVQSYAVASTAMAPTLVPGDNFHARKVGFGSTATHGDVVVFTHPSHPGMVLVSRVAATAGQTLEVRNGGLVVDGQALPRELVSVNPTLKEADCAPLIGTGWTETHNGRTYPILTTADPDKRVRDFGPTTVPEGALFVIGDNRDTTADTRSLGAVAVSDVLGVVSDRWFTVDPCTQDLRPERIGAVP